MLAAVYYGIAFINAAIFLYGKKSPSIQKLSCLFIILFVAGKRYDGSFIAYDQVNYRYNYEQNKKIIESGYGLIEKLGKSIGLSFEQFYMVLVVVCLLVLFIRVSKIGGNLHLFVPIYMLYYILVPMDQLKYTCALTIFICFFSNIYKEGKKSIILYIIGVLLAATFHPTYLFFLILLAARFIKKEKFFKYTAGIFVIFSVLVVVANLQSRVASLLSKILISFNNVDKYEKYMTTSTHLSSLAMITVMLMVILLLVYWKNHCICSQFSEEDNTLYYYDMETVEADKLVSAFMFSAVALPILFLNVTQYRMFRDLSLIGLIYLGINSLRDRSTFTNRVVIFAGSVSVAVGMFIFDIVIKGYWTDFTESFFNNVIL